MIELKKTIIDITSSKEYLQYNKYHEGNLFGITKTSRLEHMHSNFLAWLLDSELGHGLGDFPIKQFLGLLVIANGRVENDNARMDDATKNQMCYAQISTDSFIVSRVEREVTYIIGTKKRAIDLTLQVRLGERILPIIIENKVDSSEHDSQTVDYFLWAEKFFSDNTRYYTPLYVYLTPANNDSKPTCNKFILIKYQDIVDYVLEPALNKTNDCNTSNAIRTYLQCLSYQSDNVKGESIMAISKEEREILESFYNKNKNLIVALVEMMASDDDVDPSLSEKITKMVRGKDYSKYEFEGQLYGKNRLVLAVVKKYVDDKKPTTFEELRKAFPDTLQATRFGVVRRVSSLADNQKNRYFVNQNDLIHLDDTTDNSEIAVCTQWGTGNIETFILQAREYGYTITKKL